MGASLWEGRGGRGAFIEFLQWTNRKCSFALASGRGSLHSRELGWQGFNQHCCGRVQSLSILLGAPSTAKLVSASAPSPEMVFVLGDS